MNWDSPRGLGFAAAIITGVWLVNDTVRQAQGQDPLGTSGAPVVTQQSTSDASEKSAEPSRSSGRKPDGQRPSDGKPGEKPGDEKAGEKKENGKDGDKGDKSEDKPEEEPPTLRPTEPPEPPDPAELDVKPADDGLISFSFRGQPWPQVLQWLADISDMSLEWQEAPAGFLDLTTRRRYTVAEVRDLINSVLLARGYTLLRSGEILMLAKLEDLDVSLVPRVSNAELQERGTYEIVKTFFDLHRLRAETVAEELKPLLSPHGKITALKTTNRLEVVETAGNLRRLRDLLADEQDASGQEFQVREFPLRHVRADDVLTTLNTLLGIDSKKSSGQISPEQLKQQQQAMRQAMEQAQRQGGKAAPPKKDEPKVYLAVNRRSNSIVAHASPDKLAVIEQTVKYLDVPQSRPSSVSPLASVARIRNYRLTGADPTAVIKVLQEMGNLAPSTQLVIDSSNGSIIANAPMVDHLTIDALIQQLNGSGRTFEVIQLRRLDAEYVAGSIEFLMRGQEEDTGNRGYYYYRYRSNNDDEEGKFQVEADTQNNRLLLRANEIELEEIRQLLIKLGEDPYQQTHSKTMRVIRATPGRDTEQLIDRLRRLWPTVGPNPLHIDPAGTDKDDADADEEAEPETDSSDGKPVKVTPTGPVTPPVTTRDTVAALFDLDRAQSPEEAADEVPDEQLLAVQFPGLDQRVPAASKSPQDAPPAKDSPPDASSRQSGAPISITRGPQGLVITSRDPAALQAMMDLVDQISAADPSFRIFQLRHTYALDISLLLEDIFDDEDEDSNSRSPFFFFYDDRSSGDNSRSRLSSARPLKFIPDSVTNTVLVQNADDSQLAEIEALIELYDRVEPPDSQSVRKTEMVQVHYGDAEGIAAVVKDVFLDLLSPNDEALAKNRPKQQEPRQRFSYFGTSTSDNDGKLPRFKGLLSVGVDSDANMLVLSAPQFLLTDVVALIRELDDAARSHMPVVRVMQPRSSFSNSVIMEALTGVNGQGGGKSGQSADSRRSGERREEWRREERRRQRDEERKRSGDGG